MKNLLLITTLLLTISSVIAQQKKRPLDDLYNFVPGKIIVKLKDEVKTKVTYNQKGQGSTTMDIASLIGLSGKTTSQKVLFSEKSILKSIARKNAKTQDPRIPNPHTLKNTFLLELKDQNENVLGLLEDLNKNVNVEYAEPDYNFSVNDFTINSEIIYPNETKNKKINTNVAAPNDPLYSQQNNIGQIKLDQVWDKYTTGDGNQIIAILDTGIDYTHPDLAANIWINEAELNGVEGFDDDGNGYIDDIRGWDFINLDNAPLDDNMHGTHVAGIAGAVGNNGIGITGAAWNVKLMPIKVFQSNGVGNASTIAQGVTYASENGATILNMSFGSYAESFTLRNALENAYATSVLVASAGNDGVCIGPGGVCAPLYPGAYTYVIGVQDEADYSNYDQDGPIFSGYANLLNYEVKAPGSGIMSTVPNGGYRSLTGTSMSSPLVAGAIALYNQQKPDDSKELLFGNLINTATSYIDILKAIEVTPTPELKVLSAITKDVINGQNGNDFLEPGETIEIFPLVKNYWGPTEDVRVGIEFAEFEDQTKATILENEIAIGSITAYATLQDVTKSLKIRIADNVANNVNIKFNLKVWSGPDKEYLTSTEYVINVKNSILLFGVISNNMTLYPNKEYLVSDNLALISNAILTIKPGVILRISNDKKINLLENSKIIALGKKDSIITFKSESTYWAGFSFGSFDKSYFDYVNIQNINHDFFLYNTNNTPEFKNIRLENNTFTYGFVSGDIFRSSNVFENKFWGAIARVWGSEVFNHTNFINNSCFRDGIELYNDTKDSINIFSNNGTFSSPNSNVKRVYSFLGSSKTDFLRNEINDALNKANYTGIINTENAALIPYSESHGIVWKVLVNGKDAQDEYDQMDPVGVGTHEFKVYFNREMDKTKPPQISYGVREPYNQKIILEEGIWSEEGKIYTVTHEVKIGAADGINRIRVQGARDLDWFDIPIEDSRFNMLVQSAGSASTGFAATPGLGEITLDWEQPNENLLKDILGYNMYRYEALTENTFTELKKINETLITDVNFKDYEVEEGTKYFYQYKILRTSLEETDFSKTVTTQPLTSKLGDSNGDFNVNVMDLVQQVDFILGNNPKPFIFKAADVNNDLAINVLDIVGTVDIILNPTSGKVATKGANSIDYYSNIPIGDATFYWEGNELYVESDYAITGIQLAFPKDFIYTTASNLPKFEWLNYEQGQEKITMLYSFNNLQIPAGKTKLLTNTTEVTPTFSIEKAVVATTNGLKLNALFENKSVLGIDAPEQGDTAKIFTLGPNPTKGRLNVFYYLPEQMDKVRMAAYNLQGQRVWVQDNFKNTAGQNNTAVDMSSLSNGIYMLVIDVLQGNQLKGREVNKIIINK